MELSIYSSQSHKGIKLKSYSVSFKVEAVEDLRTQREYNVSAIAKKYGVDRKCIREWDKQFDKLLNSHLGKEMKRKLQQVTDVLSPDLEVAVYEFMRMKQIREKIYVRRHLR